MNRGAMAVLLAAASVACGGPGEAPADGAARAAEGEAGAPPRAPGTAADEAPRSRWLFVWAGDADRAHSDFLAVVGADPDSADYGRVIATVPVGLAGMAHHTEHVMPEGGRLFANSFEAGATFVFDLRDPRRPELAASLTNAGPYTYPHSFERLPDGNVLATFQNRGPGNRAPGGLVELTPLGEFVRAADAANEVEPHVRPYSLAILPDRDRVVTTTTDMRSEAPTATSVQIWRLSDLGLLHTVELPPSPEGAHWLPAEPRVLEDGTVIVTTFACGLFLLEGVDGPSPSARLIQRFPFENPRECALPVIDGRWWVQTNATTRSLVTLDMSAPDPRVVDELALGAGDEPHWISLEPAGHRIVLTGVGALRGEILLLRLDPESGELSLIESFRDEGATAPGVSFDRASWPHGDTGPAVPHGAVFSRP